MISGIVIAAAITYVVMLVAFTRPSLRYLHIPVMITIVLFDLGMPFYLYFTGDWYKRLILHEEIFSFLIWMHLILVLTLYALYFLQVKTARRLLAGDMGVRSDHRTQGIGIMIVRALVIMTGALLVEPETPA